MGDARMIAAVDQHARQGVGIEVDAPAAADVGAHEDVGRDGGRRFGVEGGAGARIERFQLGDHVGEVFVVDAANLAQRAEVAPRQKVEMLDQRRHRRIEAVALDQLQFQTFGHAARHHAGRLEALTAPQHVLDQIEAAAEPFGDFVQRDAQIARLVHAVDQDLGDGHVGGGEMRDQRLIGQVFAQGFVARQAALQPLVVAVEAAAALARLGPVHHRAFAGVGGLFALAHRGGVLAVNVAVAGVEFVVGGARVAVGQGQFARVVRAFGGGVGLRRRVGSRFGA